MDNNKFISLGGREIAFISHNNFFLGVVKTLGKSFLLETDYEEIVLGTSNNDILVASSLFRDNQIKAIMISTLYSLRELSFPLIILKRGHPASKRLRLLYGCGDKIVLDSCIEAGTHPDQHMLCSIEYLSGLCILGKKDGIELIDPKNRNLTIEKMPFELKL
ncbi:MAG: hypothetical protein APG12_00294 [Candidatus Methanofastidiosum methylothiophilum]|uniref:Uncharacterized protein n=1 Tax=Candidatus Methanofastidiosum methylothiophilum TaxID=1705564 RepID=A0A150J1Z8_9EURY|nr:MAG: hypothetical protein APG10_00328 [Candidatus Methanofastidiosum methylthiophilus]KYC48627.1 MAG: hypothetical protein APG11_00137 [Candidatus Methanofastidiosum methylthiophilus]KYC51168.1 MAG: hypothetical protein APG12_00294 [Candidatus Methanofastidiosum methylthiophilus]